MTRTIIALSAALAITPLTSLAGGGGCSHGGYMASASPGHEQPTAGTSSDATAELAALAEAIKTSSGTEKKKQ